MSDERKKLDELLRRLIKERIENMLFLTEDDEEPEEGPQLSWLSGQGAQEIEDRKLERDYYDDPEMYRPWDERISELGTLLAAIALDVVDYYHRRKEKNPKIIITKDILRKEILEAIEVPLDIFYGKQPPITMGHFYSLDQIIEEEFDDLNEETININSQDDEEPDVRKQNTATMGEISENNSKNRNDG